MANARFTATLLEGHKGAAFEVPFDPAERWSIEPTRIRAGRNGHRVIGTVNGVGFDSAIVPRSKKFWVEIDDVVMKKAKLEIGDPAKIDLRPAPAKPLGNPDKILALVRKICLGMPDTEEKIAWGESTWRVHGKLFAMFSNNHHGDGRIAVWCNAPLGAQQDLVDADPEHFFVPPYVGVGGWVGINMNTPLSKGALAAILEQGYRATEEKRTATKRRRGAKR
jgi:predicted DNA-binding protein (MmcQ/YjbR family)